MEKISTTTSGRIVILAIMLVAGVIDQVKAQSYDHITCAFGTNCFESNIYCPWECPHFTSDDPLAKVCHMDCNSPKCEVQCINRKPNCDGSGSGCQDPRFIGADGGVFYFHGKSGEHFTLVSDDNLQINARFMGHRPVGRTRDFTWIQALGILFNSHSFSLEATKAAQWDDDVDRLKFSFDGEEVVLPEGSLSAWTSPEKNLKAERISSKNSVLVSVPGFVEIAVNVVPVTKEDDRIHNYKIPSNDCFPHLEVQFRFYNLSSKVEGVLGRTYQPDYENPAKPGVAMPVLGGEDKYRTVSLVAPDCKACVFNGGRSKGESSMILEYGAMDCAGKYGPGHGIVCKK